MPSKSSEKRATDRRSICIPMLCWELRGEKPSGPNIQISSKDLSETGLAFHSDALYPIGTELHMELFMPGRSAPVVAKLEVIRVEVVLGRSNYLIGAKFTEITSEERIFVATYIKSVNLHGILNEAVNQNASDVHLTVGRPPILRVQGRIRTMELPNIVDGQIKAMIFPLLRDAQIDLFEQNRELDFAFSPSVESRFRVNLHQQKGFMEAAIRRISTTIRTMKELLLPVEILENWCSLRSGLILIAGKTGGGKTTTLASMIEYVNTAFEKVVITIEDPIEYIHTPKQCVIKQRELGSDTDSYAQALRHTLRQDPDIIVVGEILDSDTMLSAMRATESGHLVISTIHASDSVQALERIVSMFPPEQFNVIAQQLSNSLSGIMCQALLPGRHEELVLATEILINTPAIRNMIREGRFGQIHSYLETGGQSGMHTMESEIKRLRLLNRLPYEG